MLASLSGRNGTAIAGVSSASLPAGGSFSQALPIPLRRSWRSSASETQLSTPICPLAATGGSGVGGDVSAISSDLLQRGRPEQALRPDQHHADQDPEHDQVGDVAVQVALRPGLDQPDK